MAKLTARGRKAEAEAVREYNEVTLQRLHDRYETSYKADYVAGSDPSLTIWERCTKRLMSDGKILEKRDVRFRPSPNCTWDDPKGRYHSYGWKVAATLKPGKTVDDFVAIYSGPTKSGKPSQWTVSRTGLTPAVIISQKRIISAVQSGESIGFCTACGAEAYGVEPDANSYQCEACGQMAVSGAENLLLETV